MIMTATTTKGSDDVDDDIVYMMNIGGDRDEKDGYLYSCIMTQYSALVVYNMGLGSISCLYLHRIYYFSKVCWSPRSSVLYEPSSDL